MKINWKGRGKILHGNYVLEWFNGNPMLYVIYSLKSGRRILTIWIN